MKRTFTRRELYELVWSTPISKLAEQLEISDRGLAKTCARHHIAVPGRGYWAKVEAGLPATKTPLWKLDNPATETVHIGGAKQSVNPYVAFAVEAAQKAVVQAKAKAKPTVARMVQRGVVDTDQPKVMSVDAHPKPSTVVFEPVTRPHTSVSGLALELKGAQPGTDGEISVTGVRVHRTSRLRVVAFLHHLAVALEVRGITFSLSDKGLKASILPEDVSFHISEGYQREKHEPTAPELKKSQDYERKRELASRRGEWLYPEKFWPEFDYHYTGKLTFEINTWADGARRRWADGKHQSFETMLDSIADGVLYHLAFDKARREEREEDERRRRHLAHRRELHQKRQEREAQRTQFLAGLAAFHREADDLRATIQKASEMLPVAEPEYLRMIEWAKSRLRYLEGQNEITTIAGNIRAANLFPEQDDLNDPEGDPPAKRSYW
ncbi:hypothetical protein [Neorhizobium galegae]|uniref:hypothetical protein n=1 Tax=Neorhizobium galegae TaxID=399 RepID=UPI002103A4FC|nr:hypothetical protein [Neorhizobium galegae]MCQ1839085.1 hypothetical protein [Neorhizobium galegae]